MTLDQDFFPRWHDVHIHPDKYIDEVAVERAMKGDSTVLLAMTPPERYALLNAVAVKYDPLEMVATGERMDGRPFVQHRLIRELSGAWGMDYDYLANKVQNRRRRMYEQDWKKRQGAA